MNEQKHFSLGADELELLVLLFPFFVPQYIMNTGFVSTFVEMYKLAVLFYTLINLKKTDKDLPLVFYLVGLFKLLDLLAFLTGGSFSLRTLYLWTKDFYSVTLLCLLVFLACKNDYHSTVQKLYWLLSSWIILHVFFYYGSGIELLGIRTKISHSFIACLTFCLVSREMEQKSFTLYDLLFFSCSLFYIIDRRISTVIITAAMLFGGYCLGRSRSLARICNYYILVPAAFLLNLAILFLRVQKHFSWLVVDLLGEDLSLNKRTYIWDAVLRQHQARPWLGFGISGENKRTVFVNIVDPEIGMNLVSPIQVHSQLLSILYFNGLLGLALFLVILLAAGTKLKDCCNQKLALLLGFGMASIILAATAELICDNFSFYALLICIAACDFTKQTSRRTLS